MQGGERLSFPYFFVEPHLEPVVKRSKPRNRASLHGRRGFASLAAIEAEYHGDYKTWRDAADLLTRDGWITPEDDARLRLLWWFGEWIANSDRHHGNVGLVVEDARPLPLAPAYDTLPMLYRPASTGEVVERDFDPLDAPANEVGVWARAAEMALVFWRRVADDARVSPEFRSIAAENAVRTEGRTRSA